MFADLHVHSYYSDGLYSPADIFKRASKKGLKYIALADHDTVFHLKKCEEISKEYPVELIKAVEVSCYNFSNFKKIHVLAYGIDERSKNVQRFSEQVLNGRTNFHRKLLKEINEKGFEITWEDVLRHTQTENVFKVHLYMAMKEKYPEINMETYKKYFMKEDTKAYDLEMDYVDIKEGIEGILEDGGIPVLAHPNLYDSFPDIDEYIGYGLKGIEVDHPSMSLEDQKKAKVIAEKHHLVMTGGSDFHGFENSADENFGKYGLNEKQFERFYKKLS